MDFDSIEMLTEEQTNNAYDDLISCTYCSNCADGTYRCHYFFALGSCFRGQFNTNACSTQNYCNPANWGGAACTCGEGRFGCETSEGYNLCTQAPFSRFCV